MKTYNAFILRTSLLSLVLIMTGCASIPESISTEISTSISIQSVQQNSANYEGQLVRWGGIITQVVNHEQETWIEILALDLKSNAKPLSNRMKSTGRFIAKVSQFLDPEIYQDGLSITVVGELAKQIEGKIGEYNYDYPVVQVSNHHLWPKVNYRRYPYITPGYWYYGMSPYWGYSSFGYPYYGYGVRLHHHHGFYPYYPIFGHINRSQEVIPTSRQSGVFIPRGKQTWTMRTNPYWNSRRVLREAEYIRDYRMTNKVPTTNFPTTKPRYTRTESARPTTTRRTSTPTKQSKTVTRKNWKKVNN